MAWATSVRGWPPERSVVWRWMTSTCLAWGNHVPAGTGAVWTLRCSMRPWPRSTVWCTGGKRRLGQVADGGLQGGLVALDTEQVVGLAVTDQVAGMLGLGVERVLCRGRCYAEVAGGAAAVGGERAGEVGIITGPGLAWSVFSRSIVDGRSSHAGSITGSGARTAGAVRGRLP